MILNLKRKEKEKNGYTDGGTAGSVPLVVGLGITNAVGEPSGVGIEGGGEKERESEGAWSCKSRPPLSHYAAGGDQS